MNIPIVLGTTNFSGYAHVMIKPVENESVLAWETYIPAPFDQHEMLVTGLEPKTYWCEVYEAPTTSDLGTRYNRFFFSALSSKYKYEERIYDMHALPSGATVSGTLTDFIDPYLIGKEIFSYYKEAYNFLIAGSDFSFDSASGKISLLNGNTFNIGFSGADGERVRLILINNVGDTEASGTVLYNGTRDITAATDTLKIEDIDKRICCRGSQPTQVIGALLLSMVPEGKGFFIDNSVGGTAKQVKITFPGTDRIYYSGFGTGSFLFNEFWIGQGEQLLIKKYTYGGNSYWEVNLPFTGLRVGVLAQSIERNAPGFLAFDNTLYTSDHLPRIKWWLQNRVSNSNLIIDDTITSPSWVRPDGKPGLFAVTSDYSSFRAPDTQNLFRRNLKDFNTLGSDDERTVDAPGGYQGDMVGPHNHPYDKDDQGGLSDNANDRSVKVPLSPTGTVYTRNNSGFETRPVNYGVFDGCWT